MYNYGTIICTENYKDSNSVQNQTLFPKLNLAPVINFHRIIKKQTFSTFYRIREPISNLNLILGQFYPQIIVIGVFSICFTGIWSFLHQYSLRSLNIQFFGNSGNLSALIFFKMYHVKILKNETELHVFKIYILCNFERKQCFWSYFATFYH